jgi:hypothetical protein
MWSSSSDSLRVLKGVVEEEIGGDDGVCGGHHFSDAEPKRGEELTTSSC